MEFTKLSIIFKEKVCQPAYVSAIITGIPLYLPKISRFRNKYKREKILFSALKFHLGVNKQENLKQDFEKVFIHPCLYYLTFKEPKNF